MHLKIGSCWLLLHLTGSLLAQVSNDNLNKGRDLLLVEEFNPAHYFLNQSLKTSGNKTDRRAAQIALAELFLLTNQSDSASSVMLDISSTLPSSSIDVMYLHALKDFLAGEADEAMTKFADLKQKVPAQNFLLQGKINYYTGVIQFRKRNEESIQVSIRDLQISIGYFKKDSSHTYLKLALARLQLADAYRVGREPSPALRQLRLATSIIESIPYPKPLYLANAYGTKAKILYSRKEYFGAKDAFLKSSQMQLASNADSASIAATWINLGLCYDELHDLNNCLKVYEKVLSYGSALKRQPDRYVPFLNNYGWFLHTINESSTALQTVQKAVPVVESVKLQSKSPLFQTFYNMASIHYDLEDYDDCKKYLDRLDLFVKENPKELSIADHMKFMKLKAMWLRKENKFKEAITLCNTLSTQLDTIEVGNAAELYTAVADILMSADRFDSSKTYLLKTKAIYVEEKNAGGEVEVDNLLSMVFFQQKLYDSTMIYANQALNINVIKDEPGLVYPYIYPFEALESCYMIIASRLKLFQQSNKSSFLDQAIPYERMGIDLIHATQKNIYSDADRILYNKSVTKFYEACCLLYFSRWQQKDATASDKFFQYAEESKFQALANGLTASRVNSFKDVNSALLKEEKDLAKEKVLKNQQLVQLLALAPDEDEIDQRKKEARIDLTSMEKKHERFLDSLRRNFSGYYFLKYGGKSLSLDELKAELRPNQLILQLKLIDSMVVIQAISQGFTSLFLLPQAEALHKQISKLRNLIQFKLQAEFIPLSFEIFQSLIKPVEVELKKNKIKINSMIIVPDDFFHLLPFEALVEQTKPLRYFIQSYEISYAYSCNLMIQNKRDVAYGLSNNFLGIAPRFQSEDVSPAGSRSSAATVFTTNMKYDDYGFKPLKENENEINLIAKLPNSQSLTRTLLSGADADESHLKSLDLSKFRYIHFATHGFVNTSNSGLSGLALTNAGSTNEDNILYTSEIYNLNLKADLVCLSACETGLGENAPGEGLIGLGRAFFYSGAHNLLVSLWKVPDESTSQFMIDFYQKFFNPEGHYSTSLRAAKLKMIKSPAYQDPYYWAPFILIGGN